MVQAVNAKVQALEGEIQQMSAAQQALARCNAFLERRNLAAAQAQEKFDNLAASCQNVQDQVNKVEEIHARIQTKLTAKGKEANEMYFAKKK